MIHFLRHVLGQDSGSGDFYLAESGWMGLLGYLGVIFAVMRGHLCEVSTCHRLARKHATAAGHRVCKRHHPSEQLTPQHVREAHDNAQ